MATVTLGTLVLNLASDLSQALVLSLHSLEHTPSKNVSNRVYAGGNTRAIRTPGRAKQAKVTLNFLTAEQVATLKAWHGELVCFRDPSGEKFYGNFNDPDFNPRPAGVGTPTSFTVNEVTVSEAA
jgi:hypothetical protein